MHGILTRISTSIHGRARFNVYYTGLSSKLACGVLNNKGKRLLESFCARKGRKSRGSSTKH
jgi:hypothetical protein